MHVSPPLHYPSAGGKAEGCTSHIDLRAPLQKIVATLPQLVGLAGLMLVLGVLIVVETRRSGEVSPPAES